MEIVRKFLSGEENTPPGTRYNPDCDCIEITPDGGITWNEDPGSDPRKNPAFLLPPNTETDPKCAAAAGMVAYIRQSVDSVGDLTDAISVANVLFGIIIAFLPITLLAAVVLAVADALFVVGSTALQAAFTEGVYEQLQCILYCVLDADGRMDEDALAEFISQVNTDIPDIVVQGAIALIVQPTGFVGMSNAGAALADAEADCETCVCDWCMEFDFTLGSQLGWDVVGLFGANPVGSWTGAGFQTNYDAPNSTESCQIAIEIDPTNVTSMDVRFHGTTGSSDGSYVGQYWVLAGSIEQSCSENLLGHTTYPPDSDSGCNTEAVIDLPLITIGGGTFADIGTMTIEKVTIFGTGTNPFGTSNC